MIVNDGSTDDTNHKIESPQQVSEIIQNYVKFKSVENENTQTLEPLELY